MNHFHFVSIYLIGVDWPVSYSDNNKMIAAMLYIGFFWVLVIEVVIFILLNAPTPRGFKGKVLNFLSNNKIIGYVMYLHLAFCALALFFYLDLANEEKFFTTEKERLRTNVEHNLGYGTHLSIIRTEEWSPFVYDSENSKR